MGKDQRKTAVDEAEELLNQVPFLRRWSAIVGGTLVVVGLFFCALSILVQQHFTDGTRSAQRAAKWAGVILGCIPLILGLHFLWEAAVGWMLQGKSAPKKDPTKSTAQRKARK
jgi:uncharacterized membrane protein